MCYLNSKRNILCHKVLNPKHITKVGSRFRVWKKKRIQKIGIIRNERDIGHHFWMLKNPVQKNLLGLF
jgi:hypothetical protein